MVKIVIDPGHGGPRVPPKLEGSSWNNAVGPTGLLEKTVTLQVAKAAADAFARIGIDVILTRKADVNLGIVARAKVAKDARADAFVSIHFNAASERRWRKAASADASPRSSWRAWSSR
jgi:N-acetylmuramoyl-L-alanine amidase